jgi:pilus assembly protein CpaB
MDKKAAVLLGASLFLATTAGWAAYQYLNKYPGGHSGSDTVAVVVAAEDLTFGTKLEEGQLQIAQFPKSSVPRGTYAVLDSVTGQTSKVFLVKGEPVLRSKLSSVGGGLSVMVRPSMRAISLQIDQVTGVSGFVLPGDRVDVLVTIDNAGGSNVAVTKTALQNAEVLAAGTTTEEKNKRTITTQAVTLLVDPVGAETVALGQAQGKIHLVLRNPVDQEVVDVKPTDTRSIMGIRRSRTVASQRSSPPKRVEETAPKPIPVEVTPQPTTFTVIRDGNISKQHSATDSKPNP